MNKNLKGILLSAGILVAGFAQGDVEEYNCKTGASLLSAEDDTWRDYTMVRQWNEKMRTVYPGNPPTVVEGGWSDGGSYGGKDVAISNQIGCCWLRVELTKGQDYVLSVVTNAGYFLIISAKDTTTTKTLFKQVVSDEQGLVHYYIRASDWQKFEPETCEYYLNFMGGKGAVGKTFKIRFQQKSVDAVLPETPGTVRCPLVLDVFQKGKTTVEVAPDNCYDRGTHAVVYSAELKANEKYTFSLKSASSDIVPWLLRPSWEEIKSLSGTYSNQTPNGGDFTITVPQDYTFVFWVTPDDNGTHWSEGSIIGTEVSWYVGEKPDPQPVWAGTLSGSLKDSDTQSKKATFEIVAKVLDDDTTNFTATVKVDGLSIAYADNGNGREIQGQTTVGGVPYDSFFDCVLVSSTNVTVDGSITLDNGGVATEYFFGGPLSGDLIDWEDSFLKHDPTKESASDMGIVTGDFADEPAGSDTLKKVQEWGASKNVAVWEVNLAVFSEKGDPETSTAEAYLLDCPTTEEAIEEEKAKFVITDFDPTTGTPTVAGDKTPGSAYGNGKIEVRTSTTPGGDYDTSGKSDAKALFYRVYLVK